MVKATEILIRLCESSRIEFKYFFPNWNALVADGKSADQLAKLVRS